MAAPREEKTAFPILCNDAAADTKSNDDEEIVAKRRVKDEHHLTASRVPRDIMDSR